jgi:TolB protein
MMLSPVSSRARFVGAALVLAAAVAANPVAAQQPTPPGVSIGLQYATGSKPGVLVLPVTGAAGDSVRAILMRDFDFSDRLTVIGNAENPGDSPVVAGAATNYPLYERLGAVAVVQASLTSSGLTVSVHDVPKKTVARTRAFALTGAPNSADWRLALHGVADEVEGWIIGQRGIAQTQIAFARGSQIYLTHSDGAVTQPVAGAGDGIAMSPAWSPTSDQVAFTVLLRAGTQIMVRDVNGGSVRRMPTGPGTNATPSFSPDGQTVVYSHGEESGTDIFALPVRGGSPRRVTVGRGTDNISPTFSPDGRRIAFASGRTGSPEIWITDIDGGNAEPLTAFLFGDQKYRSNPDWSPDNRQIAFQSQIAGRFQIVTMTMRDRNVRQHTSDGVNEDPSWAPDSRHVVFASDRGGSRQLWVLDTESGRMRQLTRGTPGVRMPAWSGRAGVPRSASSASGDASVPR